MAVLLRMIDFYVDKIFFKPANSTVLFSRYDMTYTMIYRSESKRPEMVVILTYIQYTPFLNSLDILTTETVAEVPGFK